MLALMRANRLVLTMALAVMVSNCQKSVISNHDGSAMDGDNDAGDGANEADGADESDGGSDSDNFDPGLASIDDLVYLGAFRLSSADFGVSSTNYAIGALGYNPQNHSLFIAGHDHHNAVAEFAIPEPDMATEVSQLPIVESPLQVFVSPLDASPNGNPEDIDRITGMLWVEGQLLINAETWYDAAGDNSDTTLVVRDANNLAGAIDGYFELDGAARAGGYLAPVPTEWQETLGGSHLTGWSSVYSIQSRYSIGPTLFIMDPQTILNSSPDAQGPVATTALMDFSYGVGEYIDPEALQDQQGSASALWNSLSRGIYGFIIPGTRTFAVFGSSGGVDSGIGYKITQDDGNLCGGYCSYAAADNYNYYWLFDLDEILAADEVYQPQPYAYDRWSVPFDADGDHSIIGGTFNLADRVLYFALGRAGQVGDYDRPPLIVAFKLAP